MTAEFEPATVQAVLDDWRSAPVSERVRAMLAFLEKLTLTPDDVTSADVAPLRAQGLGDRAIEEGLRVCFVFNVIDRLADAFDFELPTAEGLRWASRILLRIGYGTMSVPG